jgi:colanic acid biosynthesis glycosyl transferase WcaI
MVNPHFWPVQCASTQLTKNLAEGLAEEGRLVTILTNGYGRATQLGPDHPLMKGRIHRVWNPFLRRLGVVPKLCEYVWFIGFFFFRGLAVPKIDIILVASNPPLAGLPAALLAWMKGAKMVYNLQDIFPDSAVVAGLLPEGGRLYRWLRKAEEATYRVSDLVLSISSSFSEYVQRLVPGTQVAVIPNWVDTDLMRPRETAEDPSIATFRAGGEFVVQYAGNMGFVQNLEVVVLAAECLQEDPNIRFVFIGEGNAKKALEDLVHRRGLANCVFLPLQPLESVPSVYNACDLGIIPLKPGAARIAVPSKTWNYLAVGRPVVACVEEDSPLADAIRESKSGSIVPPSDPQRLAQVILEYKNAPERARLEGRQGRDYVETHLSSQIIIRRYSRMFDQLMGRLVGGM